MGDELKWLLKAGVGVFLRTLTRKVGPLKYSKIVT